MAVKPKLCMIPSGVGTDTLYSVLPADGTGDFTFDRNLNTATRVNKDGLIEMVDADVPRLNYPMIDGVVSGCPSLLLEPARTNLIQYSEDFSNAYWTPANSNRVSNYGVSPNGFTNATLIYPLSNSSNVGLYTSSSISTTGTVSCFVKSYGKDFALLGTDNTTNYHCVFDLANELIVAEPTNHKGKIEKYPNGWYRISSTYVSSAALTYPFIGVADNSNGTVIADGNNGILIFGMQYEHEAFPTSYIPSLSNSQTTRSAETCNGAGDANTFNDSEGVLMVEASALADSSNFRNLSLSDGTTSNLISIIFTNTNVIRIDFTNQATLFDSNTDIKNNNKILLSYKLNEVKLYVNGFLKDIDTQATMPTVLNTLRFDNTIGEPLYSKTKQIQYFDSALNDTDLEELTSWVSFTDMANSQLYSIQ